MRLLPPPLWLLALGTFAIGTDGFVIAGVLPDVAHGLDVSVQDAGLLITFFAIAYAVAAPVLAVATAGADRRIVLVGSLGGFAVANVLAAVAPNYGIMMVARLLAAGTAALFTPTASGVAAMLVPEGLRGRALAVVMGGLTVATAVGVPLGTAVAAGAGWRGAFWVIAGFGAAAALALNRLLPTVSSPPVASLRTRAAVAARAPVLVSLLITFLALGGGFTMYSYIAVVLAHTAGAHDAGLSVLLLVLGISSAAGNALSGHLVDRWGATPVLALALTLMATVFAVFGVDLVSNAALTVPWIVLWGVGAWLSVPALQHRVAANAPDLPVVALSLNASALYGGIAVGGLLGGAVISHGSAVDLGIAAAVLEAAGLGVLVLANRFATRTREASRAPATAAEPTRADAA